MLVFESMLECSFRWVALKYRQADEVRVLYLCMYFQSRMLGGMLFSWLVR